MATAPVRKAQAGRIAGRSLARFIKFVHRSSRILAEPPDAIDKLRAAHPCIAGLWHGQFMMASMHRPDVPVAAMVARHGDAEFIGAAMEALGVELVRGAGAGGRKKDRGGASALRAAVQCLADGKSFVMTADVPPGPARRCGEGIITLARLSGRPIVPMAVATSRYRSLDTWSRLTINLPYSTLAFVYGDPIHVPRDLDAAELEHYRQRVEAALNAAFDRAYVLAGADPARATPRSVQGPSAKPTAPGARLKLYRGVLGALNPLGPQLLKFRERQGKEDPARRGERLGYASAERPEGRVVWVHAASIGETNAAMPVVDRLSSARSDLSFVFTTGTVTSAEIAASRLGSRAIHQYVPLDTPQNAARFLDHWRPDLAVFTESEIWPNLILATSERNIPLALINARMSARSARRWRRQKGLSLPLFSRFAVVLAQNDKLARQFSLLGSPRVINSGNIKIDAPAQPVDRLAREHLERALGARPILVAASTHDGEEDIVAAAHRLLNETVPGLCTIIAPRHPERGTAIAEALKARGFKTVQRSSGALPAADTEIYVADTIGELGLFYALGKVVFLGGSLVAHGGQNPIEAIRHDAAVISGPSTHNFIDVYRALRKQQGFVEVASAPALAEAASALLSDSGRRERQLRNATAALESLGGALQRTADTLIELLPPASSTQSAPPAADDTGTQSAQGLRRAYS